MRLSRPSASLCGLAFLILGCSCGGSRINGRGTGGTSGGTTGGLPTCTCSILDPVCGASGCDDAGACLYPAPGTPCPGVFCRGSTFSELACNGNGSCEPTGAGMACPDNFACAPDGGCNNTCGSARDCIAGLICNAGVCGTPVAGGACTENDACTSGICGASGTGNCCLAPCATNDLRCGSTGCDEAGSCLYPAAGTVCSDVEKSCTNGTQTNATLCDGSGHCAGGTMDCAPFICDRLACKTSCALNADCESGAFCDVPSATCCPGLIDGGTLLVDSILGDDSVACCGFGSAGPCHSLTRATGLIAAGPTSDVLLRVTVDGGASGDWAPEGEAYPILLGWGVELSAPGIFFRGPEDAGVQFRTPIAIFKIDFDAGRAAPISIVGTESDPISVGMDTRGNQLILESAIAAGPGSSLYVANMNANGNWGDNCWAITAAGTLILGQDRSGAVTGPVRIGNDFANSETNGYIGIECDGCTLSDVPTRAPSTLVITGQEFAGIYSEGNCSISLTSAPVFGVAPASLGFSTCPAKPDRMGIYLTGTGTLNLDHATLQCIQNDAIVVGEHAVALSHTTIQNTGIALGVYGGTAVVSNSMIRYNGDGVVWSGADFAADAGTVDLSGGAMGGRNTIACNNDVETYGSGAAVSVWNGTSTTLNASNVDWDTPGPDLFDCDAYLQICTCPSGACIAASLNGIDVVCTSTGAVITTGNGLSTLDCTVPPG